MTVGVEVSRNMARVIVVLAGNLFLGCLVAMAMRVEVTRHMPGMVVVLAGYFLLSRFVPMPMRVEVAGYVARMVVVFARLLLRHVAFPSVAGNFPGRQWFSSPTGATVRPLAARGASEKVSGSDRLASIPAAEYCP